ncbi:type I-E CRISPR-associated protein Cas6/Cse3/CasE [Actinospica sp.]|uniref:type I-E CRISPR-associated protein Cas6/Cse3/CasE n=1 Tax=Actinospica sp. TaxID=1872142 RepID=UPI002CD2F8AE|nr:type I-E CRISPR-associated protein Cas6/Cse3/CasE [Actinospica sp.]HWG23040.1 type I-E CRISPR-associated protein Cas6/Cse3/CasE [Actinospica sp.]
MRPVTFVACQSVLELDLGHVTAQRAVLDPQFLHKMVMSGFYGWVAEGEPNPRAQLRVLHAARVDLADDLLTIITQSRVQPDWDRLAKSALRGRPRILKVEYHVETGQRYSFRTIVHATRDSGPKRRRRDLTDPKDVLAWFMDRLQPEGEPAFSTDGRRVRRIGADARTEHLEVKVLPAVQEMRDRPAQRLIRSEIQGVLTVTDPPAFADVLQSGFGRSRSLGCGLVLVEPLD